MGHFRMPGVPIHFEKTPGEVRGEPPTAGRDTNELLRELGYDAQRVGALLEKGVVVQGEDTAEVGLRKDR
jgi:crotonobetainyl-CoA:carnitine CoA-transferase CaiB-like acyl-CoA transferase